MIAIKQRKDFYKPLMGLKSRKNLRNINSVEQFHTILEREKARAERNSHQFSLVLFEVKKVGGDISLLRYFARSLSDRIRWTDEVGWFSDERKTRSPFRSPCLFSQTRTVQTELQILLLSLNNIAL